MAMTDGAGDDTGDRDELPFVDEHTIRISAPRQRVWAALERHRVTSLCLPEGGPLATILGTSPPAGFEVARSSPPERLVLAGRHRFSRYRLVFELAAYDGATLLTARTYAVFPGARGRVHRALVIGTGVHVIATRRILRAVRRTGLQAPPDGPAA